MPTRHSDSTLHASTFRIVGKPESMRRVVVETSPLHSLSGVSLRRSNDFDPTKTYYSTRLGLLAGGLLRGCVPDGALLLQARPWAEPHFQVLRCPTD